ncbi:oplophorus-luciferin 2-monooxygenase non-catalytic subunit-like [Daphnia pulicaria]|uniref:oplophorus-luciferin 2-monooxygenase non-catalytic subunit-like n=1 Tax=Daphnia pulicaria TaxID=35523 RepID=UPI001EEC9469|nr:oplophorus-luciferin 2-monooxygenase non-catalytic subunit-like [Daphnia pulicaria]
MKGYVILLQVIVAVTTAEETILKSPINEGLINVVNICQEDYYPCTCETYPFDLIPSLYVNCKDVPSFESVQAAFRRTSAPQVKEFILTIPIFETNKTIPADLLSGKAAQEITLNCPSTETQLTVDPAAFNSSEDYTNFIKFSTCDLSQLDYKFLTNFNVLKEIYYSSSINVSRWPNLPNLPSLRKLSINSSPDFKDFKSLPISQLPALSEYSIRLCPNFKLLPNTTATKTLIIESCPHFNEWDNVARQNRLTSLSLISLDSQTIENALDKISSSPVVDILEELILTFNGLTQVPSQIQLFSQLQNVTLSDNNISTAENGSLAFSTPKLKRLFLNRNGLSHFESEAFQGDFSVCEVRLGYNNLTKLESSVFKSVLEQMDATDVGYFSVENNPFECDCDLAWIFRDNLYLRDQIKDGKCTNGSYFSSLGPTDFAYCNEDTSTSLSSTTVQPTTTPSTGVASRPLFDPVSFLITFAIFSFQVLVLI